MAFDDSYDHITWLANAPARPIGRARWYDEWVKGYQAWCSCGWSGPPRTSMGPAHNDALEHENQTYLASLQRPIRGR